MKRELVEEVIACLGGERTVFHYYPDRYCVDNLKYEMHKRQLDRVKISQLKKLTKVDITQKPNVSSVLKYFGDGSVALTDFQYFLSSNTTPFILTLGSWGDGNRGSDQTTRNQSNLVLQLNFNRHHVDAFERLIKPVKSESGPFEFTCHPITDKGLKTMSWIRMDVDFTFGTVLIEEVQNDWIRYAESNLKFLRRRAKTNPDVAPSSVDWRIQGSLASFERYVDEYLLPYKKIWAEASMTASIHFIRNELGISTIYYHTFDTGRKVKCVSGKPPKSIYTKLPKQFGFEITDETPEFLLNDKVSRRYLKSIKQPQWYRLH